MYVLIPIRYSFYPFTFSPMFRGKISCSRIINGREHTWEREFTDPETYRTYMHEHPELRVDPIFVPMIGR